MATNVGAKKRAGIVLIILGVILLAATLLPSAGGEAPDRFGPAKVTGIVTAAVIVLVGVVLTRKKGHTSEPPV